MIAALLYKEYREHRSIWLALAVFSAGVLLGVPFVLEKEAQQKGLLEALRLVAGMLAWTYGMVCGAMLLAGESEGGTQVFLDTLPRARLPLWGAKCLIGCLFLLLQVAFLAVLTGMQKISPEDHPEAMPLILVWAGLTGLGWGLLFSTLARNVLNAIGMAILVQVTIVPFFSWAFFIVASVLAWIVGFDPDRQPAPALILLGVVGLPLPFALSALIYSRVDRKRKSVRSTKRVRGVPWYDNLVRIWWLSWKQTRGLFIGLIVFCLAAGIPVIGGGVFIWPVITLGVGVFCGVAVFLDEQSGAYRFLGDQRYPLSRIWFVKVGMYCGIVILATQAVLLPAVIAQVAQIGNEPSSNNQPPFSARVFQTRLMGETIPPGLFVFLFPLYGFAVGNVCGMLFRKPLAALVVGVGLGVLLASLWLPSLVAGGLHFWQVAGPPLVLLVCARQLMRVWASDRLASWETARIVGASTLVTAGLVGLGLWYRVAEFPDTPEPDDFAAFVAGLPTPEENQAGQLIRSVCSRLEDRSRVWSEKRPTKPLFPGEPREWFPNATFIDQTTEALKRGWPDGKPELAAWLDAVFAEDLWKRLAEAATKPTGVVEDPRRLTYMSNLHISQCGLAGQLLPVRGLQMQKMKGDPAVFVDHFATALALVRNLLHDSPHLSAVFAVSIESRQLEALAHWLENLNGRPDLLRRAAAALAEHQAALPADYREQRLAEYLIALNSLDQPQAWLPSFLPDPGSSLIRVYDSVLMENAWLVPWEKARLLRQVRAIHWDVAEPFFSGMAPMPAGHRRFSRLEQGLDRRKVRLDAAELMVALRRFQAETRKPAETLEQLTPKFLTRIPTDPFAGKPYRYRLSKGEVIGWPPDNSPAAAGGGAAGGGPAGGGPGVAPPGGAAGMPGAGPAGPGAPPAVREPIRKVPAGQGILWSVGEDHTDDGGMLQGLGNGRDRTSRGEDLIYLVPLPATRGR